MAGSKKEPVDPKRDLTFEQTLALLAQVPKSEIEDIEEKRTKRPSSKRVKGPSKA